MFKQREASVLRVRGAVAVQAQDWLAVERPLQIQARVGDEVHVISTTMRTPGEDRALAAGFLFSERVIRDGGQIRTIETVDDDTVLVGLVPEAEAALESARRPFITSGACGVCGRTNLDALFSVPQDRAENRAERADHESRARPQIALRVVHALPGALRTAQTTFARTGGLHAAGLFTPAGVAISIHEDVGRHNAVDKLVGTFLLDRRLPDPGAVLVVSGRASFELVQKAAVAGIRVMVAVGAPSSLAVDVARGAEMTLIGFARDDRFNVYSGAERLEQTPHLDCDGRDVRRA